MKFYFIFLFQNFKKKKTIRKLDGVALLLTDPPPTSSTTLWKKKKKMYLYICNKRHLISDMWHVTYDTWGGMNILKKIQVPNFFGLEVNVFWRFWGKGLLTESVTKAYLNKIMKDLLTTKKGFPKAYVLVKEEATNTNWKFIQGILLFYDGKSPAYRRH